MWDETLYAGSAAYYVTGRMPYPAEVADALRAALSLDGGGRLLDVGCGPGSMTLLLAPLFAACVGRRRRPGHDRAGAGGGRPRGRGQRELAAHAGRGVAGRPGPVPGRQLRAVVPLVRPAAGGRRGAGDAGAGRRLGARLRDDPPGRARRRSAAAPRPPRDAVAALVTRYLGPVRRAGQGRLPAGTPSGEEEIMVAAGYRGPERITVGGGTVMERSEDEVVASVFSLSGSAPHLFGARVADFERDLRALLTAASPGGWFAERTREIELIIWRP